MLKTASAGAKRTIGGKNIEEQYYFAYGSNMNLDQMDFRCPDAEVVENARLDGYRLAFCGRPAGGGVATILKEEGSHVNGVLWKITDRCKKSLDRYEGYPYLYGKEVVEVQNGRGKCQSATVYVMNAPYKDCPARPSELYLKGILEGCRQNRLPQKPVMDAVQRTREEMEHLNQKNKSHPEKDGKVSRGR